MTQVHGVSDGVCAEYSVYTWEIEVCTTVKIRIALLWATSNCSSFIQLAFVLYFCRYQ
jgi:hypothetical protein